MQRTSKAMLVLVAAAIAALGGALLRVLEAHGVELGQVQWIEYAAIGVLAVAILVAGLQVRAYVRGKRPNLSALRAARTYVLAKAAALTGAILAGRYLASVLALAADFGIPSQRAKIIAAAIAALVAAGLAVVGLIVEAWCQVPPADGDAEVLPPLPDEPEPHPA